jgi:hypothetical protein
MSYHFDTDPSGFSPVADARRLHFDTHNAKAHKLAASAGAWVVAKLALWELGTALHPLQDIFSHYGVVDGHRAEYPMLHAPKVYCTFLGDPTGTSDPFCKLQKKTSINWLDPHFPDNASFWVNDLNKTQVETQRQQEKLLEHICISCWCQ